MINQHIKRKSRVFVKPTSAVDTGSANIPPPMEVPTISKSPPINLDFCTINSLCV
jgi:hypothetical protein